MDLAYCGLNCGECAVYLASVRKDTAEQIRLADEYSTDTYKFSKEDMYCLGCHSDTVSPKMCGGLSNKDMRYEKILWKLRRV